VQPAQRVSDSVTVELIKVTYLVLTVMRFTDAAVRLSALSTLM
jgi:hypothetical protein